MNMMMNEMNKYEWMIWINEWMNKWIMMDE